MTEFEEYCWKNKLKSGYVKDIPPEYKNDLIHLCRIGYCTTWPSPSGIVWKYTNLGWSMVELRFKPPTLWERIKDFWYKHILRVKFRI